MKVILSLITIAAAAEKHLLFGDEDNTFKLQFYDWEYTSDMGSGDDFPLTYTQYLSADAGITYRTPMGKDVDGDNITVEGQLVAFAGGVQYVSFESDYLYVYAELNLYPMWWNLLDHTVVWKYPRNEDSICMTTASDLLIGWVNMNIDVEVYECNWSLFNVSY